MSDYKRSSMIIRRHDLPYIGKRHLSLTCLALQPTIKFFRIQAAHSRVSHHIPDFMAKRIWDTRKKLRNSFLFFWNLFFAIQNLKTPSYPPANAVYYELVSTLFSSIQKSCPLFKWNTSSKYSKIPINLLFNPIYIKGPWNPTVLQRHRCFNFAPWAAAKSGRKRWIDGCTAVFSNALI